MRFLKGEVGLTTALVGGEGVWASRTHSSEHCQTNLCGERSLGEFNLKSAVLFRGPETPPSPLL